MCFLRREIAVLGDKRLRDSVAGLGRDSGKTLFLWRLLRDMHLVNKMLMFYSNAPAA